MKKINQEEYKKDLRGLKIIGIFFLILIVFAIIVFIPEVFIYPFVFITLLF